MWGCNPLLAQARACENHVYVVSSTYMAPQQGWMLSAVYDHTGQPIAQASNWGTVALLKSTSTSLRRAIQSRRLPRNGAEASTTDDG